MPPKLKLAALDSTSATGPSLAERPRARTEKKDAQPTVSKPKEVTSKNKQIPEKAAGKAKKVTGGPNGEPSGDDGPARDVRPVPKPVSGKPRARPDPFKVFNDALEKHLTEGDIFVVDFGDEIQAWKPVPEYFEQISELAKYYEYPFDSSTRFYAQAADKRKYEAQLKFIVKSEEEANAKVERLRGLAKALQSKQKADDKQKANPSSAKKAQKSLAAEKQTEPIVNRTPRNSQPEGSSSQGIAEEQMNLFMDDFPSLEEMDSPEPTRPKDISQRKRPVSPSSPHPSAAKKVLPSSGAKLINPATHSFMPASRIAVPAKPSGSSAITNRMNIEKTHLKANNQRIQKPSSASDAEEFKWPFEISADKVPLCPKLGGKKIYIDEGYRSLLDDSTMEKGPMARSLVKRLLLGPDDDHSGMRRYFEMRREMRARNEKLPGMTDFLGQHFMLNIQTFLSSKGHDTKGSWLSKTLGSWKDEFFKKHQDQWESQE